MIEEKKERLVVKMTLLVAVVRFVVVLLLCKIALRLFHFTKFCIAVNKVPGPVSYPLSILAIPFQFLQVKAEERCTSFYNLCKNYKSGILRTGEAFDDVVINIYKPQLVEVILSSNTLITKATLYEYLEAWFGNGILTSTGERWAHKRKTINPAFHFEILNQFQKIMAEKAKILTNIIEENLKANPEKPIDIHTLAIRFSFDTICETIMGINLDLQRKYDSDEYSVSAHKASEISIKRMNIPWLLWDWLFFKTKLGADLKAATGAIRSFATQLIKKKREARKIENKGSINIVKESDDIEKREKKPFLDLLLDLKETNKNFMTEADLLEEVNTFMFGGYDTVAAGMNWVIFDIGNNPEIQEELHQELDDAFGDSKKPATMDQINELKYLERVIKESLRLHPPGPTISRRLTEDVELDGYHIPKGCTIHVQIFILHRNPEVWPDPLKFDPDRFLPENCRNRHPYSYVPFSAGPRNCIGQNLAMMEIKFALTSLLRKWRVKSVKSPEEMKMIWGATLLPYKGNPMYFIPK